MKLTVREYRTRKILAEVTKREFSALCNRYGWLPHHKVGTVWFVMVD